MPEVKTNTKKQLLCVDICEAKENKLFTEEQRQLVRFLVYNKKIPCAECGRKVKIMWTMLCEFYAMNITQFSLTKGKVHQPLIPVCGEHPLQPAFEQKKIENPELLEQEK